MYNFLDYQDDTAGTDLYPKEVRRVAYALGLCSEAGEYAGKLKKFLRGDHDVDTRALAYELGDILWYLARAAYDIGYDLDEVALMNIHKLQERKQKGALRGDGDDR